jgi:hypothetical protein
MLRPVALIRTYFTEEYYSISSQRTLVASFLARRYFVTLMMVILSSETSVLIRATRNIPEDGILHNNRRENLRSYIR